MNAELPEQQGQGGHAEVVVQYAGDAGQTKTAWGDSISAERRADLQGYIDRWQAESEAGAGHGDRKGPFDSGPGQVGVRLTGADVSWLAKQSGRDKNRSVPYLRRAVPIPGGAVPNLHLEGAYLRGARLEGASLRGVHLERADLREAHLEGASLMDAQLERANLIGAHLGRANLINAQLERANLEGAQLQGARLEWAQLAGATLDRTHLEGADLSEVQLQGAHLRGVHLERADLSEVQLQGAYLREAHLEGASLREAHLEGAHLEWARLAGATLDRAHLEGADLSHAHLEGAHLEWAQLAGTRLRYAHLAATDLIGAHLEGKTYAPSDPDLLQVLQWDNGFPIFLPPADLRDAVLDGSTILKDITLGDAQHGGAVRVADTRWGGANLAVVDWTPLIGPKTELGDERTAWAWKPKPFKPLSVKPSRQQLRAARTDHDKQQAARRLDTFRAAVRANRQLATALRDQGMNEEADQFAYRAQVLQRQVFRQQHKRVRAIFSWFLDRVAGHGYKPQRSLYTYVGVILLFAVLYLLAGNGLLTFGLPASQFHALPWYEALILSVSSFHGRGFFQPLQTPGDPVAIIAALEAIFGLFIEVSFIATFTQRFFGK